MLKADLAIIGGTGVYQAEMLENVQNIEWVTDYGKVDLLHGRCRGREIVFLPRHGQGHTVPPHLINYRANIQALKDFAVKRIIATAAVGSLNREMAPCNFVLIDQFLDFTKMRSNTFFAGGTAGVAHVDVTTPYCVGIRQFLQQKAKKLGLTIHQDGCYVCAEGPRFETAAEIKMFRQLGGDVVGMTGVPEVVLAREAGICYASLCLVTNYAAGISAKLLSHAEVLEVAAQLREGLAQLLFAALSEMPLTGDCDCAPGLPQMLPGE